MRRRGPLWASLLLSSWSSSVAASPGEMFGFGARSQSLAGTGAAHARGYAASSVNPARLDPKGPTTFGVGVQAQHFRLQVQNHGSAETESPRPELAPLPDALNDATQAVLFGISLPLRLGGILKERFALGLGVATPGKALVRVRILNPERPQFPLLNPRAETVSFNLGFAARLTEDLTVGLGASLSAELVGKIDIDAGGSGSVRSVTDDELRLVNAAVVGASWQPASELTVGAVWRQASKSKFALQVEIDDLGQVVVPPLNVTGLAQVDPEQLTLESAVNFGPWLLSAGATLKRWSKLKRFKDRTVVCPSSETCGALPAKDVTLSDTVVPRVAAAYEFTLASGARAELRAGYFLEPTPLAQEDPTLRLFDNTRHVLSAGYGLTLSRPIPASVNFATQWHRLSERTVGVQDQTGQSSKLVTRGDVWTYALDVEVPF